jgi:hypothetical protein
MVTPLPSLRAVNEADPLDSRLGRPQSVDSAPRRWSSRWRLALGFSPTPGPGFILLLFGAGLGPQGLGVLTDRVLNALDPGVSVTLAALGVLVGLDLKIRRPRELRLLTAASFEAGITTVCVAAGVLLVHSLSPMPDATPWLLALVLGICASPSSTPVDDSPDPDRSQAMRVGDLDDVLPIVLGALALAWMRARSPEAMAVLVVQGGVIAAAIALAWWLLVTETSSDSERRVFTVGALLLLGGTAAYLSLSMLFAGLVAGACWSALGSVAADRISRDMWYLQHPLIVLLLVVAGARLEIATEWAGLIAAYVVFRIIGKLVGGWLAGRIIVRELPQDIGLLLSSPGALSIALALNVLQAGDAVGEASTLFAIAVAGSLGSELLRFAVLRAGRAT